MKAVLGSVSSLCFCGILLCLLAYTTGNFPMPKTTQDIPIATMPQQTETQKTAVETDPLCSPCVERMAFVMEMLQEWEAENTHWDGESVTQSGSESIDKSGIVEIEAEGDCSPCEENLKHLKVAQQRWERERKAAAMSERDSAP